ncbi:MAG: cyclic-di-AMP receptor [Bellilinea sp.]
MKLIIAIVRDTDSDQVSHALTTASFRVTGVASSGGFLRKGKTTLLIGVEDEQVESALQVIRSSVSPEKDEKEQRAVIFVIKVDHFDHF